MKKIKQAKRIDSDEVVYYFRWNHKECLFKETILNRDLNDMIKACEVLVGNYFREKKWNLRTRKRWI